ncbi:MAG: hypothetical protein HFH27_11075 [Clostridiaceae bacterium]|nr:hypothetical protein [Clostridiaceae bacterium]
MKSFEEFRKSIDQDTLNIWSDEIHKEVEESLKDIKESDPDQYFFAFPQTFSFKVSMRLLEAYHNWLNQ